MIRTRLIKLEQNQPPSDNTHYLKALREAGQTAGESPSEDEAFEPDNNSPYAKALREVEKRK